jgi:hypothetical protein
VDLPSDGCAKGKDADGEKPEWERIGYLEEAWNLPDVAARQPNAMTGSGSLERQLHACISGSDDQDITRRQLAGIFVVSGVNLSNCPVEIRGPEGDASYLIGTGGDTT